jgi:uncharacterized protein (TIGR02679 family)
LVAVQMPLVAVVAVAAPAGQVLQRGPGGLPVAAAAGAVAPGFGAQQPLGALTAPLVCANAHPGAAATVLLRQLAAAGARLCYHGDFDWPGITIANGIIGRFGAHPWRFDAGAYRAAAARGGASLRGRPVMAAWDPCLTEAMLEVGVKVEEERVLGDLLADLEGRAR